MNLQTFEGSLEGSGRRFAVVCSRFNEEIVGRLLSAALDTLEKNGAEDVAIYWVPGAFEIPLVAKKAAEAGTFDAVICLGCVIRGETAHFDLVANESARGIMEVSLKTGLPVIYGVLATENREQANRRSGINGKNLGVDFAEAALEMVNLVENSTACV